MSKSLIVHSEVDSTFFLIFEWWQDTFKVAEFCHSILVVGERSLSSFFSYNFSSPPNFLFLSEFIFVV